MSIVEKHQEKLELITDIQNKVRQIENQIHKLERLKLTTEDFIETLDIDRQLFELRKTLKNSEHDDSIAYLLRISTVFREYESKLDHDFASVETQNNVVDMNTFVEQRTNNKRGELYAKYMQIENDIPVFLEKQPCQLICVECQSDLKLAPNESYVVCENCGHQETHFEPSATGLTYEQEVNTDMNVHFSYKRINHLRELLSQLQAKESSDIPEDVLNSVRAEFKKERILNINNITQDKVKKYLKKCGLNKYYEHTRQITNILSGTPPPVISNQLNDKILSMFIEIQEPFERVCPKSRKNFFSYNYILYKFCELLGSKEHMNLFPLLKSREKLYQQDCIWKEICTIKGWCFIKSV